MKKTILKFSSFVWKISTPLLSAILGLLLVRKFNIFQAIKIVKDEGLAFDVCTTVYFSIFDIFLLSISDLIKRVFFPAQTLQVTLSRPGDLVQNDTTPDLLLTNDHPNKANLTIKINANKKTCRNLKLIIEGINFATIQLPSVMSEASVDLSGNFILDIEKIFGNQQQADTIRVYTILFMKEPIDGSCQSKLYTKLNKEPCNLTFKSNAMIVRTEDR